MLVLRPKLTRHKGAVLPQVAFGLEVLYTDEQVRANSTWAMQGVEGATAFNKAHGSSGWVVGFKASFWSSQLTPGGDIQPGSDRNDSAPLLKSSGFPGAREGADFLVLEEGLCVFVIFMRLLG